MKPNNFRPIRLKSRAKQGRHKASALLSVMAISAVILVSVSALVAYGQSQRANVARLEVRLRERAMAETVVDSIVARIRFYRDYRPANVGNSSLDFHKLILEGVAIDPNFLPAPYELVGYKIESPSGQTPSFGVIDDASDDYDGYSAIVMDYKVSARVRSREGNAKRLGGPGTQVSRLVRVKVIPLYQYAIFFENTLELDAGARIDIHGKVHTNKDFYLTSSSEAYYWKGVSVAGRFFSGIYEPHTGRGASGSDRIYISKNGVSDDYANAPRVRGTVASPDQWLDSRYGKWLDESYDRYKGYLRDSAHGTLPLELPLPSGYSPRTLIDPAKPDDPAAVAHARMQNNASVIIKGDPERMVREGLTLTAAIAAGVVKVTSANGAVLNPFYVDAAGKKREWLSATYLYNGREEKNVYVFDVDAGILRSAVAAGAVPGFSSSGVVYVNPAQPANAARQAGARLSNAAQLPKDSFGSFTFATNAPVYTKGDVNTLPGASSRALAVIAGDSINVLSNAFVDAQYQGALTGNGPKKDAATTETNAVFLGGNTPSDKPEYYGRYSGGAENFFRYLENWTSSRKHTFRGSIMNLWESQIARASWDKDPKPGVQSSGYYAAPRRDWYWDETSRTRFPPPYLPSFWLFELLEWEYETPKLESLRGF